ncbi:MAG: hypothetical protein RLZZ347_590 [Candidatus Parcubacteria bacterium]|jgi:hypothetical protein
MNLELELQKERRIMKRKETLQTPKSKADFFAVTTTSVYALGPSPQGGIDVVKIAIRGDKKSKIAIGSHLQESPSELISIGRQIVPFIPEGGGNSFQREIAMVNTRYWGKTTSPVVALFKTRKKAMACLNENNLVPCDPRWEKSTIAVLRSIDPNHSHYSISHYPGTQLMSSTEWKKKEC